MAKQTTPSLADFAKTHHKRVPSWCDKLPEDVQEQLIATECSVSTAVQWLTAIGHGEGATPQKVQNWRAKMRHERGLRSDAQ